MLLIVYLTEHLVNQIILQNIQFPSIGELSAIISSFGSIENTPVKVATIIQTSVIIIQSH